MRVWVNDVMRHVPRSVVVVACLLAFGLPARPMAAEWPQFRGPERDGMAAAGPALMTAWPDDGPPLRWVCDALGDGYASATVTADAIFTTGMEGDQGFLYALDHAGQLRWKVGYGPDWARSHRGSRTTPTAHDGKLYLVSAHGRAVCFDAQTGRELWSVDMRAAFGARIITWGITESPLIVDDKVIFSPGGPAAGVVALDAATGETVWVCADVNDVSGYCSPIHIEWNGRGIIAQLMGTTFVGIDASTGDLLWRAVRQPTPAHNIQAVAPVFEAGRFYVTSGYGGKRGEMYQLNPDGTGVTSVWRDSELDCHHGGVILHEGFIYGAADRNNRNQWLSLNLADGTVAGRIDGVGKGSVAFADGMLYTLSERGMLGLVAATPDAFRMISAFQVPSGGRGPYWAHPAIANGRLYIRHASSLFVYDITAR